MSTTRKKLILHVGLHKTGTTYFQRAVWPSWQEVSYAGKPAPEPYPSPWQALEELPAPVLLSSEGMTGSLTQSYLEGNSWLALCRERISTVGDTLRDRFEIFPILTVRDPESWALSIYKHYLKYGGVDEMDEFFGIQPGSSATCPLEELEIAPRVRMITDALGRKPFVLQVERLKTDPDTIATELARFVGVRQGPSFPNSRFNEGLGSAGKRLSLAYNRTFVNPGQRQSGYIRRSSKGAFRLLRLLRRTGVFRDNKAIRLSANIKDTLGLDRHHTY